MNREGQKRVWKPFFFFPTSESRNPVRKECFLWGEIRLHFGVIRDTESITERVWQIT